jgi:hypothetical protein
LKLPRVVLPEIVESNLKDHPEASETRSRRRPRESRERGVMTACVKQVGGTHFAKKKKKIFDFHGQSRSNILLPKNASLYTHRFDPLWWRCRSPKQML